MGGGVGCTQPFDSTSAVRHRPFRSCINWCRPLVRRFSMEKIEKVLPPQVTGPIAIIIGLSLAGTAFTDAINLSQIPGITEENQALAQNLGWVIALVTLLATIMFSVYVKRKTWGQIPILLGLLVGYVLSLIIGWFTDIKFVHFALLKDDFNLWQLPHFTLPKVSWQAALAIMPIAIATIPESTAHLFQLDIYVKKLAVEKQTKKEYKLSDKLGINLIGDGIGDMVSGMIEVLQEPITGKYLNDGNYKNYSVMVLLAGGNNNDYFLIYSAFRSCLFTPQSCNKRYFHLLVWDYRFTRCNYHV